MPNDPIAPAIAKSGVAKAIDAMTPDFLKTLYHKLAKAKLSLTSSSEIAGFNALMQGLTTFCDSNQPLNICPEIAACWKIFSHTQITATVYEFSNPFTFAAVSEPYERHQTVQGRTYWDYPFTNSILSMLAAAPALKDQAKQSLVRLVFGYISSVAVVIASLDTETKKYEGIRHLHQFVKVLIREERCRKQFDKENTQILVQVNNQVTHFFSIKHAEREAAFIPEAVEALKRLSREQASLLFTILLIIVEGNKHAKLTRDYQRITRGIITDDVKSPVRFNTNNPFVPMLIASSELLSGLHDDPMRDDVLKDLKLPSLTKIESYINSNLSLALAEQGKSSSEKTHSLLYFFMRKIDADTRKSTWMEPTDLSPNAIQLYQIARWLKFHLTIASVTKDLSILLSMEGQKWLAQSEDATIIQAFIHQVHAEIPRFNTDMSNLHHFMCSRIDHDLGREHDIFHHFETLDNISTLLVKAGISRLLNIEEKYLLAARYLPEIRRRFFEHIQTVLANSELGFRFEPIETDSPPASPQSQPTQTARLFRLPDDRSSFSKISFDQKLSHWIEKFFNTAQQPMFLDFWRKLLYVEEDRGIFKGSKLIALEQFHQKYQRDIQKLAAQRQFLQDLQCFIKHPETRIAQWAAEFLRLIHNNAVGHDVFLAQQLKTLSAQMSVKRQAAQQHLSRSLDILSSENTAWEKKRELSLMRVLEGSLGLEQEAAGHFLVEMSHRLRQLHFHSDNEELTGLTKNDEMQGKNWQASGVYTTAVHEHSEPIFNAADCVFRKSCLEPLLDRALDHLVIYADNKQAHVYWQAICRGLMTLGASPLQWMKQHMTGKSQVASKEAPAFFVICQQATFILSSINHRARFLAETSLLLQSKFDDLVAAIEAFGQFKDLSLEHATLFWAVIHWFYVSIHEQQLEPNAEALLTCMPQKDKHWIRLDAAITAYRAELPNAFSLRDKKEKAIALDLKTLEPTAVEKQAEAVRKERREAEAQLRTLQAEQQTCLKRHLSNLLEKNSDPALGSIVSEVADIHGIEQDLVEKELNALIATDERFVALREKNSSGYQSKFFKPANSEPATQPRRGVYHGN